MADAQVWVVRAGMNGEIAGDVEKKSVVAIGCNVMGELSRPTFSRFGLSEYCRFISVEELQKLCGRVRGFSGHLQESILDRVAIALE